MAILGFSLNKMSIEKKKPAEGAVNIKTNVKFVGIKEVKDIAEIAKDRTALNFEFEFSIKYEPGVAEVSFAGFVLNIEKKEDAEKILKDWKNKKIDTDLRLKLTNTIWVKCNIKAFFLEEEIGLPIHIPLPRIGKK